MWTTPSSVSHVLTHRHGHTHGNTTAPHAQSTHTRDTTSNAHDTTTLGACDMRHATYDILLASRIVLACRHRVCGVLVCWLCVPTCFCLIHLCDVDEMFRVGDTQTTHTEGLHTQNGIMHMHTCTHTHNAIGGCTGVRAMILMEVTSASACDCNMPLARTCRHSLK